MYAPVLLPSDRVSPAVLAAEAAIVAAEGRWHVNDAYFANEKDAAVMRRREAEHRVSVGLRDRARLRDCEFCHSAIEPNDETVTLAGVELHKTCALDMWYDSPSFPSAEQIMEQFDVDDAPLFEEAA